MNSPESTPGARGLVFREPLLRDISVPGRMGVNLPREDVTTVDPGEVLPDWALRKTPAALPEVSEPEVVRHFTRLSQWNFSIDSGMYPLGSCTMKYNPKVNEVMARLAGFAQPHPATPDHLVQGALELMYLLEQYLAEITGLARVTLQPAAGAHGEFCGVLLMRAFHVFHQGHPRTRIIVPESAHGTNPASCTIAGYEAIPIKNGPRGIVEPEQVAEVMDEEVAGLMLTCPNTLGLFEERIGEISEIVHKKGGLVYMDGANLNAILGAVRPGDMGVDVMHLNLHKTFSTPHGGGGPGAGPVAVQEKLAPFLPVPVVVREKQGYRLDYDRPESIGKLKCFYGNFGMLVRAYAYIRSMGPDGLKRVSEIAVLNANYIKEKLKDKYHLPFDRPCMHEVVLSDKYQHVKEVKTLDIAKRLIDYGFHPPTIYFPLVVPGALMIEPTESESKATLDQFVDAMRQIAEECDTSQDVFKGAPHASFRRRLDETRAARNLVLRST